MQINFDFRGINNIEHNLSVDLQFGGLDLKQ